MDKKIWHEIEDNESRWGAYYPFHKHMDKKIDRFLETLSLQFESNISFCIEEASFSGIYNKVLMIRIKCSDKLDNLKIVAIFKAFLESHECYWR